MTCRIRRPIALLRLALVAPLVALLAPGGAAGDPPAERAWRRAQVLEAERLGLDHPAGLAWSQRAGSLVVLPRFDGAPVAETELRWLGPEGWRARRRPLPLAIEDPLNATFDNKAHRLLLYDARLQQLVEIAAGRDGLPDPETLRRHPLRRYGIESPQGLAADPVRGHVFLLDAAGPRVLAIEPDAQGALARARVRSLSLSGLAPGSLRGLAYDPTSELLYAYAPGEARLYALDAQGVVEANHDLSGFGLRETQALAFAPSGDTTDDPAELSLFVAEAGAVSDPSEPVESGRVTELSMDASVDFSLDASLEAAVTAEATSTTGTLVRVIHANNFNPPSPDAMGIDYIDEWDALLLSDSEVEEIDDLWEGDNLFKVNYRTGTLIDTMTAIGFSDEPVGVAYDPVKRLIFISHDNGGGRLFVIARGNDGVHFTNDDSVTLISTGAFGSGDPEGIAFDRIRRSIFIADGVNSEVYELRPGSGDVFGDGNDTSSHFDSQNLGATDPEAIGWETRSGNVLLLGNPTDNILEIGPTGTLIRTINVSAIDMPNPSGLGFGPHSSIATRKSAYVSDRGVDNDDDPNENDGKIYEITFDSSGGSGNLPPVVSAGPDLAVTLPNSAFLNGTVTGEPGETLTSQWFQVGGPGVATFVNASAVDTNVSFSAAGTYVLRLTADDGQLAASDDTTVTVSGAGGVTVVDRAVAASSDDAEQAAGGSVSLTSSDLELVFDGSNQTVGLRFTGVPVPRGASIVNAWIQFTADESGSTAASLLVRGQAADNAGTFTTASGSLSSRPLTAAAVSWSPPAWTTGQAGTAQRTPGLANIVAEIIARSGWASGNAMVFLFTGTGVRTAEAFDGSAPPVLHLEYSTAPNNAPGVTITAPSNGASFDQGDPVSFSGSASDTEDGNLTASLAWSSSLNGPIGSGGSFSRSDLSPGSHTITASVTDSGGRSGSAQIAIQVVGNNTPPGVTMTAPADGASFVAGTSIGFAGSASDTEDGNLTASLAWTSSLNGVIGAGGSFSRSDLSPGTHTITASVTDSGGASASAQRSITVTNTPPSVTLTAPANGASFDEGAPIAFSGSASDGEQGNLTASLAWTSSLNGSIGTGGSFTRSNLSPGTHVITASVSDAHGASDSEQVTIQIRANLAPVVTISSPANNSIHGPSLTLAATAQDPEDGNVSATLTWSSNKDGALGSGATLAVSGLSNGRHTITATATDSKGRQGSASVSVRIRR